jgi:hypothetical protein
MSQFLALFLMASAALGAETPAQGLNLKWSLGPELGIATSHLDMVDKDNRWTPYLKAGFWPVVTEDHDATAVRNNSVGLFGKLEASHFSFGLGYRAIDLGKSSAVAKGSGGVQYINIVETVSANYSDIFAQAGAFDSFWDFFKASLQVECGYDPGNFTDEVNFTGYNGAVISHGAKIAGSVSGWRTAVLAGLEWSFTEHIGASLNGGYQFLNFPSFKVDSSRGSTYKPGDTVKNSNGSAASQNLDGLVGNLKLFWLF